MESEEGNGPRSAGWLELPNGGGFLVRDAPLPATTSPEPSESDDCSAPGRDPLEAV